MIRNGSVTNISVIETKSEIHSFILFQYLLVARISRPINISYIFNLQMKANTFGAIQKQKLFVMILQTDTSCLKLKLTDVPLLN